MCEAVPEDEISRVYSRLVHKIRAKEVAVQMLENGALQQTELNEIQHKCSHNNVAAAEYLLNIVMARPLYVYESFLRALERNNQIDAYHLLTYNGLFQSILFFLVRYKTAP